MVTHSYTSRRELEQYTFHPATTLLVPVAAILLQVLVPMALPRLAMLDLPLIAAIFFAVSRRNPVAGTLTGAVIGLLQDTLSNQPIGVNGMAKCVIGNIAASIGVRVDVENSGTRVLMIFSFSLLQSILLYGIERHLLGMSEYRLLWLHEVVRALANTAVGLPLFLLLDKGKRME